MRACSPNGGPVFGQTVVTDNRASASGSIAAELVARAAFAGYTLLFGDSSLAISPAVFAKLTFTGRLALTNSGCNSHVFHYVRHSK